MKKIIRKILLTGTTPITLSILISLSLLSPVVIALPDASVRDQVIYFVMPDRFSNGKTSNDLGGYSGNFLSTGYDPTNRYMYHGGDIVGLTQKLDYIKNLGASTIWTTPIMANKPIQMEPGIGPIAGYHGYWIYNFLDVDKHLGTAAELKAYIHAVHANEMKSYFDIVVNHTANVINYKMCSDGSDGSDGCSYVSKASAPYKDIQGTIFDDADYAYSFSNHTPFPTLDLNSFPLTPLIPEAEKNSKNPSWLNNPINYHNRGTFSTGESTTYGDFARLDDLFTSNPIVIQGMVDIFNYWIDEFGIDGYRIDATRHVEDAFLRQWTPAIEQNAKNKGHPNFFIFGEVYDADPVVTSHYIKEAKLPSVIDFGFQDASRKVFSSHASTKVLSDLFANDDHYLSATSNAYFLPTFLGNHDMGRFGAFLKLDNPNASDAELLARSRLAHALMFTARGIPVIYYGDEQGFTGVIEGSTNFESARQDMFPSQTPEYINPAYNSQIGTTATPASDNFDPTHPLYKKIQEYAKLRASTLELRQGSQLARYSDDSVGGGIFAFSRIITERNSEVLVVFNTHATQTKSATFATLPKNTLFKSVYPVIGSSLLSDASGSVTATLPPLSFRVFRAKNSLPKRISAPEILINYPTADFGFNQFWVGAALNESTYAKVSFFVQYPGSTKWAPLGTDDNEPYRVNFDGTKLNLRDKINVKAVVTDYSGNTRESASKQITIENRLNTVKVIYENGNHRDQLYTIRPNAQITLPQPLSAEGYNFNWPADEQKITFFFESEIPTEDKKDTLIAYDRPLELSLVNDIIPNAELTANGLSATLYVNNAHQISKANNFGSSPAPATLPFAKNVPRPIPADKDFYIRGSMNGWGSNDKLTYIDNYTFSGTTTFAAPGNYSYKFADADWSTYNLGIPFTSQGLDTGGGFNDIAITIPPGETGLYSAKLFAFPALNGGPGTYYLFRLSRNLGPANTDLKLFMDSDIPSAPFSYQGNGQYQVDLALTPEMHSFHVADKDNTAGTIYRGTSKLSAVVRLETETDLVKDAANELTLDIITPATYRFIFTMGNDDKTTIKVSRLIDYGPYGALYLRGGTGIAGTNGWNNIDPANLLIYNSSTKTLSLTATRLSTSTDAGDWEFKFSNEYWDPQLLSNSNSNEVLAGSSYPLSTDKNNKNLLLKDKDRGPGKYIFEINATDSTNPLLTITKQP